MGCHGQAACKGTIYTTFLWDDSVPHQEQGPAPTSKRFRSEDARDRRVDSRTESTMLFDKATLRSANAAMFVREPRQNDDPYRAQEREQEPESGLRKGSLPMSANDSSRSMVVSPSMAQPLPPPISAPATSMAPLLPGTKKRPSAAKWMDSAVSSSTSRSGSMDAARRGADQAISQAEERRGSSPRGEPAPATSANNMNVVLSRLALDPSVVQRAKTAREILQQHQGLLGLGKPPMAAPASSTPSVLGPLPSSSDTVSGASMSGASAVSALNQLVSRAPRHDSQSTMVADISPLIPSKDMSKTLGGLLDYPPSTVALTESANAAASAARRTSRYYDPVSPQGVSAANALLSGFDTASSSATAVDAMASSMSKHGYPVQQQHYQSQELKKPHSVDNNSNNDGVSSLLGILAQVRKTGGTSANAKKL
ncbi:hypothetical protein IWW57_004399 [Coemansia sp. S610]|nr:hypothetical protein IWW57_004399 [Coemansia sp. S610]